MSALPRLVLLVTLTLAVSPSVAAGQQTAPARPDAQDHHAIAEGGTGEGPLLAPAPYRRGIAADRAEGTRGSSPAGHVGVPGEGPDSIPSPGPPFAASVLAGTAGSAIGALVFAAIATSALDNCGYDDIGCFILGTAAAGAVGSVVGSVAGTHLLARHYGESPSLTSEVVASTMGGLIGVLAGTALIQVTEDDELMWFIAGFSITQGTITAMGARSSLLAR